MNRPPALRHAATTPTTGIVFYERVLARDGARERYEVQVIDRINGLELCVKPADAAARSAVLVLKLTGDEARDLADALERAANRVYPQRGDSDERV